jgi:hypothetical protein
LKDNHSFIIAVIIIATISVVLISSILSLSIYNRPLSDEGHNTVSQIITALIAIVSMIIGNKSK